MFPKSVTTKESFLELTKAAREERANEKRREQSAVTIQAVARGWIARQRFYKRIMYVSILYILSYLLSLMVKVNLP